MLAQVLIAKADAQWKDLKLPDGRGRAVRHRRGCPGRLEFGARHRTK
jgi:hypothetical protein